jgi:hypothetical protein
LKLFAVRYVFLGAAFSKAKNLPVSLDFADAIGYEEKIQRCEFAEAVK